MPEPVGGAHRDWERPAANLKIALREQLADLSRPIGRRRWSTERYEKFRRLGAFEEASPRPAAR